MFLYSPFDVANRLLRNKMYEKHTQGPAKVFRVSQTNFPSNIRNVLTILYFDKFPYLLLILWFISDFV